MTALSIALTLALLLPLATWVGVEIWRTERRRAQWRRERPQWWGNSIGPVAVRQSTVLAGEPSPVVLVEERDPRIVTGNGRREWKKPTGHQRKAVSA